MQEKFLISLDQVVHWFNAVRDQHNYEQRTRALDAFWDTQLYSKSWLVSVLNQHVNQPSNVYVFGGWIGVLANLLLQSSTWPVQKIINIDIDPECMTPACTINHDYLQQNRFEFVCANMRDYIYDFDVQPDIVINTSTEHVDQETYDIWYDKIYPGSLVVIQGNDFFDCPEHIRCTHDLDDFVRMNHAHQCVYTGILPNPQYTRFMAIFRR